MIEYFFIAGAQRCGTTYLYHLLEQHPEIDMARPVAPEPKFFLIDNLYVKGLDYYKKKFFADATGARVRGEKSTSYIEHEKTAERIAKSFPSARVLFVLRDPILRAISNYRFSVQNGYETLGIEEAFRQESRRRADYDPAKVSVSPFSYLQRGKYIDYLEPYVSHFPADRVKIVLYEELISSPENLRDIYRFLRVDPLFQPVADYASQNTGSGPRIMISASLQSYMREFFRDPNDRLRRFLGRPIEAWTDWE